MPSFPNLSNMPPLPWVQKLLNAGKALLPNQDNVPWPVFPLQAYWDWPRYYQLLIDYYENTSLYDQVTAALYGQKTWREAMKGLRNPAFRIVEFYVKHVWQPGLEESFPIEGASAGVKAAIEQVWEWSNWERKKTLFIRRTATCGDGFLKVAQPAGKQQVFLQVIDPRLVTEVTADEQDQVTRIRMDDRRLKTDPTGTAITYWRTEVWDAAIQMVKIYEHLGNEYNLAELQPDEQHDFAEYGIDFVPFVWVKFRDIGEPRGAGAFSLLKDKIDEVNRAATRLHQILFRYNKPIMAVSAGGADPDGRPLPPPTIAGRDPLPGDPDSLVFGEDDAMQLPGDATLSVMVPNIDYGAALDVVMAQLAEIERDAPELLYFRLIDTHEPTGRAIRFFLGPAIQNVEEVRSQVDAGLIRAHQMALAIGQHLGVFDDTLGSYAAGDFKHAFAKRDVIPIAEMDEAEIQQHQGQAAVYWYQVGISREAIAARIGFDPKKDLAPEVPAVTNPNMPTNTPQPKENPPATSPPGAQPNQPHP